MSSPFPVPSEHLIDGKLVGADDGRTFDTLNPATGATLAAVADAGPAEMDRAIAAARRSFDDTRWSTDHAFRAQCLSQLQRALVDNSAEFKALTTAEVGAPSFLLTGAQYDWPVDGISFYADLAASYAWRTDLGTSELMGIRSHRWMEKEAAGVVGAITPWNFPNQINLAKMVPALAAGCTVVLKPAPDTPACANALARIVAEHTDIPAGVVNVVNSTDHALGAMLSTDPRVDVVSFTGSTATGRAVMAAASGSLKRVFLELGGKSAFVVLDDADLPSAIAMAAFAACTHAGQGCAITTRLLVPRAHYDRSVEIAAATMESIGCGDPTDDGTVCGPVISARQRDRIEAHLQTVVDEGGSFATGGSRPADRGDGFWISPTLVAGLDNSATVAREEVFGPVLVVIGHDGDDDAVAIANDSPYGLSGAVHSADADRALSVARRIRTGTMSVNGGIWYGHDVPFGGYKQSGIGREMGVAGFEEYLETKSIAEGI